MNKYQQEIQDSLLNFFKKEEELKTYRKENKDYYNSTEYWMKKSDLQERKNTLLSLITHY